MVHAYERSGEKPGGKSDGKFGRLRGQVGTAAAVAALHVGLGAALLSTFAGGVIADTVQKVLKAEQWIVPMAPPPPSPVPPVPKPAQHRDSVVDRPDTVIKLDPGTGPIMDSDARIKSIDIGDILIGDGPVRRIEPTPSPSPTALFQPRAAKPLGNPGLWVSRNDYPTRAIREGWEGQTRLRLTIGADGRATGCEVIGSSGHDELDSAACARVSSRARFEPAMDDQGRKIIGTYTTAISWRLEN